MLDNQPKYCSLVKSHYFQQYLSASYKAQTPYFRRYSTISTAHEGGQWKKFGTYVGGGWVVWWSSERKKFRKKYLDSRQICPFSGFFPAFSRKNYPNLRKTQFKKKYPNSRNNLRKNIASFYSYFLLTISIIWCHVP